MMGESAVIRGRKPVDPEKRKRSILKATIALVSEQGYERTNIQDIANASGIAKGTVYLHFKNKEDVFVNAVEFSMQQLADTIDIEVSRVDSPRDKITAVVLAFLTFLDRSEPFARVLLHEAVQFKQHAESSYYKIYSENSNKLQSILQEGVLQGEFRPMKVSRVADTLAHLLSGAMFAYLLSGSSGMAVDQAPDIIDFLFRGIAQSNQDPNKSSQLNDRDHSS